MKQIFTPMDGIRLGREYIAEADAIGKKVAQLRREYRRTRNIMVKMQMENWREIETDLRCQGLELLRRGERNCRHE